MIRLTNIILTTGAFIIFYWIYNKINIDQIDKNLVITILITFSTLISYILISSRELKDNFTFEVTKPKLCDGGPYMLSSASSELQQYCNFIYNTPEYQNISCSSGYSGRPVSFDYTPESNNQWINTRCNSIDTENKIKVF